MKKENGVAYQLWALGIAAVIGGASYFIATQKSPAVEQKAAEQEPGEKVFPRKLVAETGLWSLEALVDDESLVGVSFSLSKELAHAWANYAPVRVQIPELNYSAPLPVENGVSTATTKFGKQSLSQKYTYTVVGRNGMLLKQTFP